MEIRQIHDYVWRRFSPSDQMKRPLVREATKRPINVNVNVKKQKKDTAEVVETLHGPDIAQSQA